ncbi:rust resistance kinase Lr10-like isoform X2 [Zingiber officinale]|uniref:rust resistance kinase Lr10-like isoform X2 n=1 Tax=Zingiber officinale TaxID=94328 RepID=UPI001C4CB6E4|nr:rust resistance kinase Lr10-like isoform X2 [Zingiber officinale]
MKRSTTEFFSTSLLLLFFLTNGVLGGSKNKSCNSSCGVLVDIHYPFRLQSDPEWCGKPEFELICESGKDAVLHKLSSTDKYLVTEISYNQSQFRLVYAGYATDWLTLSQIESSYGRWASFMSCKQEIHSDLYKPIHCLTGENSSTTYAIVDYDAYAIRNLKNSCRFVNLFPVSQYYNYSDVNVFELLAEGVWIGWDFTPSDIFEYCWKNFWSSVYYSSIESNVYYSSIESNVYYYDSIENSPYRILGDPLFAELRLLGCVYREESSRNHNHIAFGFTVILVLALDIALCLLVFRFVMAPLSIYAFLAYNYWKTIRKPIDSVEKFLQIQQALTPTRYAYSDIIAMTSHFREKLGQGGFGSVYRGYILGKFPVAVKMLVGSSKFHGEDFISEVSTIGRIHHINVVRLVGFCSEGSKRALIYEYMPNGSLDKYIFSANRGNTFTVEKLHEVALGIARGINYLHQGCDMQILHFDIKPHNILLDRNFIPKISDFGLAKLYPKDKNLISMSVTRGTIGYIAPELISRNFGIISDKSDVYSFGMLLMEMAGGRHNVDVRADNTSQVYYPSWVYDKLVQLHVSESSHDIEEIVISEMERKLSMVGLWCIQIKSSSRPSMSRVVEMLEGDVNELQLPPKPFFSSIEPSPRELEIFTSAISSSGEEELHEQQHTLRPNYSGLPSSSIQLSDISEHS